MATEGQSVDLAGAPRQHGPQSPGGPQPSRQSHSGAGRASGAGTPLDLDHPRMVRRDRSPDPGDSYAETDEQNDNTIPIIPPYATLYALFRQILISLLPP